MESFSNKTVLITGAAGFLGSHLTDAVLSAGARVIGVDNFVTGSAKNIEHLRDNPNFTFIQADVISAPPSFLPSGTQLDYIFHFASLASPPLYQAKPTATYLVNSIATHNLLQYLLQTNPQGRFIFASTSEVYGDPLQHPQKESYWGNVNPNGARSCYDESKRLGETICGVHERDFKMDVRIVRIFNTYGPRMDINDGRVIPNFIKEALAGQKLSVYGDGSQTRSYCYVDDLISGIVLLATKAELKGVTVNLGNPTELTVLETAQTIWKEVSGEHTPGLEFLPLPADDPMRRRPDIALAEKLLDWRPITPFEQGLKNTVAFFTQQ